MLPEPGSGGFNDAWACRGLVQVALAENDAAEARRRLDDVPQGVPIQAHRHPDQVFRIDLEGWVRLAEGDHAGAGAAFEKAAAELEAVGGYRRYELSFALHGLGEARLAGGDRNAAVEPLRRALALRDAAGRTRPAEREAIEDALRRATGGNGG